MQSTLLILSWYQPHCSPCQFSFPLLLFSHSEFHAVDFNTNQKNKNDTASSGNHWQLHPTITTRRPTWTTTTSPAFDNWYCTTWKSKMSRGLKECGIYFSICQMQVTARGMHKRGPPFTLAMLKSYRSNPMVCRWSPFVWASRNNPPKDRCCRTS